MSEAERKYIHVHPNGRVIFKPLYKKYSELFLDNIIEKTKIKYDFNHFHDTSIYERYQLNSYQFSAAKSEAEAKMLQAQVFGEDGVIKGYSEFKKDAKAITDISQETWLRVEYENCRRQAVQADMFNRMRADSDLYPFWIYKGVMDDREREDHVEMEGQVFRIGDPAGDECYPPNDWNCRCEGQEADEQDIGDKDVNTNAEAQQLLEDNVDKQFRYNPADQGMLPNTGSYFDSTKSANSGTPDLFGMGDIESSEDLDGFSARFMLDAKGLHAVIEQVNEWRQDYHVDDKNNIVFQYDGLFTNVRFNNNSLHAIQKHSRGFENIPATVISPNEVWQQWADSSKQRNVLRNYIKYGKNCYVVQTSNGYISDAFAVSKKQANKYRKGLIA